MKPILDEMIFRRHCRRISDTDYDFIIDGSTTADAVVSRLQLTLPHKAISLSLISFFDYLTDSLISLFTKHLWMHEQGRNQLSCSIERLHCNSFHGEFVDRDSPRFGHRQVSVATIGDFPTLRTDVNHHAYCGHLLQLPTRLYDNYASRVCQKTSGGSSSALLS
jgi:hypothetical protein